MLPPGFEPGFRPREGRVLDRTRLQELLVPGGFEPPSMPPEGTIYSL